MDITHSMPSDSHAEFCVDCAADKSFEEYPPKWYEKHLFIIGLGILTGSQVLVGQLLFGWFTGLAFSFIGSLLYVFAALFDIFTTRLLVCHKQCFDRAGLEFPYAESNMMLPEYPTLRNLFISLPSLISILILPTTFIVPAFGVTLAVMKCGAGANNLRGYKRILLIERSLQL